MSDSKFNVFDPFGTANVMEKALALSRQQMGVPTIPYVANTIPSITHFNRLSPSEAERLAILSEELGEVQQAIGKILRHGYESYNPDVEDSVSNRMHLTKEIGDVMAACDLLVNAGDLNADTVDVCMQEKLEKLKKWTHHQ